MALIYLIIIGIPLLMIISKIEKKKSNKAAKDYFENRIK